MDCIYGTESSFRTWNASYRYTLLEGYVTFSECLATFIHIDQIYVSQWTKEWTEEILIQSVRTSGWLRVEKEHDFSSLVFS